ncbi:MAG: hypothetical protein LBF05_06110 [Tannerella sp.]|nr:hypothetical protein [Tannerella sp.]
MTKSERGFAKDERKGGGMNAVTVTERRPRHAPPCNCEHVCIRHDGRMERPRW